MTHSTEAWDNIFVQRGKVFKEPHEDLPKLVQSFKDAGANKVLDLGCGTSRHVVYLARHDFSVFGLDNSPEGLRLTKQWLEEEGLVADLRLHNMKEKLPYKDSFFDAVISIQVIHHAEIATIIGMIKELCRVLKMDGILFATVPSTRNQGTAFKQLEPNTFIPLDGLERGVPHHYFTPEELREVFEAFDIIDFHLDTWEHYCLLALKT